MLSLSMSTFLVDGGVPGRRRLLKRRRIAVSGRGRRWRLFRNPSAAYPARECALETAGTRRAPH